MQKRLNDNKKSNSRRVIIVVVLLLFLFLLLWFFDLRNIEHLNSKKNNGGVDSDDMQVPETTMVSIDTVPQVDTIRTVPKVDSTMIPVKPVKKIRPVIKKDSVIISTTKDTVGMRDTVQKVSAVVDSVKDSTVKVDTITDKCREDTTALWVYPDPSGGLHRKSISVSFISNRPCMIQYRFKDDLSWRKYEGIPLTVEKTSTILFDAIDSCGKVMEERQEFYEIEVENPNNPCISGMEYVKLGNSEFCIDRFEWPNKRGSTPQAYVSLYQAMDSCYSVGKRLCTSEEWYMACSGPYSWKYPYGQLYEKNACTTHDTSVFKSGSRPECRSYYGSYDMAGNLLEWTSTKAVENRQFSYVMGGFWESGPKSGCNDRRYSYFPENKHNPVGFRCCSDLAAGKRVSGGKFSKEE